MQRGAGDAAGKASPELDRHAEKIASVTITKKLKPTASLVFDLLVANGFPSDGLRIEDGAVVWDEATEKAAAETREYGRRILLERTCRCGARAQSVVHAEKRCRRWVGCEYANVYSCRHPSWMQRDWHGRPECPDPEAEATKLMTEGFMVCIDEIPWAPEE